MAVLPFSMAGCNEWTLMVCDAPSALYGTPVPSALCLIHDLFQVFTLNSPMMRRYEYVFHPL